MVSAQNLGPLTSTYTLPSSCANDLQTIYKIHTVSEGWYYLIQGSPDQTSCYPDSYNGATTQYYSPGVCPSGFTAACSTKTASETIYNCCPTDYDYQCLASVQDPAQVWQSTLGCTVPVARPSGYSQTLTFVDVSSGSSKLVASVAAFTGGINAYRVQVRLGAGENSSITATGSGQTTTTKASPSTTSKVVSSTRKSSTTKATTPNSTSSSHTTTTAPSTTSASASTTSAISTVSTASAPGLAVARGLSAAALMSVALFILA